MDRIHNTTRPLPEQLRNVPQHLAWSRKPAGLWWSDGAAWKNLVAEGSTIALLGKEVGEFDYRITLPEDMRLLVIDDFDAVVRVSRDFGRPMPHASRGFFWQRGDTSRYDPDQDWPLIRGDRGRAFLIDWAAVARAGYEGVEVRIPVGPDRGDRPSMEWLDLDWDLPSGCAWSCDRIIAEPVGPEAENGLGL